MRGEKVDLECVQNTDFSLVLVVKDDITKAVIDFTGYSLEMEVQRGSNSPILSTGADPATITSTLTSLGLITVSITDTITQALSCGEYDYNITLVDGSGLKEAFFYGSFTVISSTLQQ